MKKRVVSILLSICMVAAMFGGVSAWAVEYEYAWFPAPQMNLSQLAYESYSHGGQNAIDILPGGDVFAPFTGKIAKVDSRWGYVIFQSLSEVHYADGTIDYMTAIFMHDEDIGNLSVGDIVSQGEPFYQAGGMGAGDPDAYSDHVHLSVFKGLRDVEPNSAYYGNGDTYAYDAFFVNEDITTIINPGSMESGNSMNNNSPADWSDLWTVLPETLPGCTISPTYAEVKVTAKTCYLKTLPYSVKTNAESVSLHNDEPMPVGTKFVIDAIILNTEGNTWYRTSYEGERGYLYSGDVTVTGVKYDVKLTDASYPTGTLSQGSVYPVGGTITTSHRLETVYVAILRDDGSAECEKTENIDLKHSYSISQDIDNAMTFNTLSPGNYRFVVRVTELVEDPGALACYDKQHTLVEQDFSVG